MSQTTNRSKSKLVISFAAFLVLILFDTWILYFNFHRIGEQESWVKHTYSVLEQLDAIVANLRSAEVSSRTFVSTGESKSRSAMEADGGRALRNLQSVLILTEDNFVQQEYGSRLTELFDRRIKEIRAFASDGRSIGAKLASERILKSAAEYDELISIVASMKSIETNLLHLRGEQADKYREIFLIALAMTALLNVLVAFVAFQQALKNQELGKEQAFEQRRRAEENEDLALASSLMAGEVAAKEGANSVAHYFKEVFGAPAVKVYLQHERDLVEVGGFGAPPTSREQIKNGLVAEAFKKSEVWTVDEVPTGY